MDIRKEEDRILNAMENIWYMHNSIDDEEYNTTTLELLQEFARQLDEAATNILEEKGQL